MPTVKPSPGHFKDNYVLGKQLGQGAYATVYECTDRRTQTVYAVKVVDKSKAGPKDIGDINYEINVMGAIGYHPHVVQMIEFYVTERHLYIILDLLTGGMLFDRIVQLRHYSENNAAQLVGHLLSALHHVHSKGFIHRDLKPENLLLRQDVNSPTSSAPSTSTSYLTDVCLADFGLAGEVPSSTCCGSPSYIAPEVINVGYYRTGAKNYDSKCDIWSLGVITYILLSGKMPFHGRDFKDTFERIVSNKWSFSGETWSRVTPVATEFIKICLTPDPALRPSAAELMKHPWVATTQPDVHLEDSLESLKKFNAQQKVRAAVRVFCWTQSLLGPLDWTPPFMRYLRHSDKYSTVLSHQSQTHADQEHRVDFGKALDHNKPGWRIQDCCTCPSEKVCRHIQNVHEYLFVGKRSMDVYPFIDELRMLREEAEADVASNPKDANAADRKKKVARSIEAACIFSDELARVPQEDLKPNVMLDASTNNQFRASGGSRTVAAKPGEDANEIVGRKMLKILQEKKAAKETAKPAQGTGAARSSGTSRPAPVANEAKATPTKEAPSGTKKKTTSTK